MASAIGWWNDYKSKSGLQVERAIPYDRNWWMHLPTSKPPEGFVEHATIVYKQWSLMESCEQVNNRLHYVRRWLFKARQFYAMERIMSDYKKERKAQELIKQKARILVEESTRTINPPSRLVKVL